MEDQKLRATGRTTRLVDIYVQELFTKGICVVVDHCDMSHRTCAELVIKRIKKEHHISVLSFPSGPYYELRMPEEYRKMKK